MGRPGRRAGVARAGSSSPARPSPPSPPPSLLASLPLPLRGPGARLCTFLPGPQFGRQELRGRDRGPERPRRFPAQGLLLTRGPAWACAAGTGDLGPRWLRGLGVALPGSEVSGSWPARGAKGRERRSGLGIRGSWRKKLGLKFRGGLSFLVGKTLFARVRRAVARVRHGRELKSTPNESGRVPPASARKAFIRVPHFPCSFLQSA